MPSLPSLRSVRCALLLACGVAACADVAAGAEEPKAKAIPPRPAQSLALESYGYRPSSNNIALRAGYTNATVSFIDADNILLTYSARKLMARNPEQREGDDDHTVRAVVVHLPDGKAVRETEWRMHDRAPYLWPLADGRFLLRIRGNLYSLDPLGSFDPAHLGQRLAVESSNDLVVLQLSPTRDLMILETAPAAKIGDDPEAKRGRVITANFFRIAIGKDSTIQLTNRGRASTADPFSLAFTSMGVLQSIKEDRTHWGFDFHSYGGKNVELAGFTTTCRPRPIFISDAEFFAYGCRGGEDRRLMGGFNLMAEAKWVFTTDDPPLWLSVDAAPAVGRFAMRNTVTSVPMPEEELRFGDDIRGQEVRVFGDRLGNELLRVTASPTQRPDGNFALAPDGLRLAVLHDTQLEIYNLPPIDAADRKLHEREVQALAPLRKSAEADIAAALSDPDQKSRR